MENANISDGISSYNNFADDIVIAEFTEETVSVSKSIDNSLNDKLNSYFAGKIVRKDLTKKIKEGANVPI